MFSWPPLISSVFFYSAAAALSLHPSTLLWPALFSLHGFNKSIRLALFALCLCCFSQCLCLCVCVQLCLVYLSNRLGSGGGQHEAATKGAYESSASKLITRHKEKAAAGWAMSFGKSSLPPPEFINNEKGEERLSSQPLMCIGPLIFHVAKIIILSILKCFFFPHGVVVITHHQRRIILPHNAGVAWENCRGGCCFVFHIGPWEFTTSPRVCVPSFFDVNIFHQKLQRPFNSPLQPREKKENNSICFMDCQVGAFGFAQVNFEFYTFYLCILHLEIERNI